MASIFEKNSVLLTLGSSSAGPWGRPDLALCRAVHELQTRVGNVRAVSRLYRSRAIGGATRKHFFNLAIVLECHASTAVLLRKFKRLEFEAGRRSAVGRRWGDRTLDIDIVDHGGRASARWSRRSSASRGKIPSNLILPHASAHLRAFVLVPVVEILPDWWHPVLRKSARQLLHALPPADVRSVLEFGRCPCDKVE